MEIIKVVYNKAGAEFANGDEAQADKNSFFGVELTKQVNDCYAKMLSDGILLEPVSASWDQSTCNLTIIKKVSSFNDYVTAVSFDNRLCQMKALAAGWTYVDPSNPS